MDAEKMDCLTAKFFSDELTAEDRNELMQMVSTDAEAMKFFADTLALDALLCLQPEKTDEFDAERHWEEFEELRNRKNIRRMLVTVMKYAAAVITGAVIAMSPIFVKEKEKDTVVYALNTLTVPVGQRASLVLSDGTSVWLSSNSSLTYPGTFDDSDRQVELSGEAYFSVKRNNTVPFRVKTNSIDVEVFGTEFNVSDYGEQQEAEVQLIRGSIAVTAKGSHKPIMMQEQETVIFKNDRLELDTLKESGEKPKIITTEIKAKPVITGAVVGKIQNQSYFRWKDGILSFNNESVKDIFTRLEKYYGIKIVVDPASPLLIKSYKGKFYAIDGPEQALKLLQKEYRFKYKRDNSSNTITIQ
jgi:ferric-dicitrate binding protein FerR (iron transport regulator)